MGLSRVNTNVYCISLFTVFNANQTIFVVLLWLSLVSGSHHFLLFSILIERENVDPWFSCVVNPIHMGHHVCIFVSVTLSYVLLSPRVSHYSNVTWMDSAT